VTAYEYRIKVIAAWRLGCVERSVQDQHEQVRGWFVPAQRTATP
jgi:hypothetical protein